jgi:molybdate transport system substrate-binding protein
MSNILGIKSFVGFLGAALLLVAGGANAVTVYGAVSTTNAMEELAALYQQKGLGTVTLSLGATSTQARQVERGAPADIFISADEVWMDYLAEKNKIIPETRASIVRNTLAIITQTDRDLEITIEPGFDLTSALGGGRLAVGDPDHTSVGIYFKEAMESLGSWDSIEDRLARAQSVRAGTALVERGEVPFGVSFGTEVAISEKVRLVATFPEDSHKPITYPIAVVDTGDRAAAEAFISFLRSDDARNIWEKWMFVPDF